MTDPQLATSMENAPQLGRHKVALVLVCGLLILCGCSFALRQGSPDNGLPIAVGQPEIYENADLQSRLNQLQGELAALNVIDQPSLISAIPNVQAVTTTQSGVNLQVLGPGSPTLPPSPGAIAAPAAVSTTLSSRGALDQQYQLSSQIIGYQLLLTGSEFARYTSNGAAKDRLVIGFPISINAGDAHRDQAAEVRVVYYAPNAGQFDDPREFSTLRPFDHDTREVCSAKEFSPGDQNAAVACLEQERSPTLINILPSETSYNTVGISSKSATLGLGAVIGTVNAGVSGGVGRQTQYLLAEQDTVALEESGPNVCKPDSLRSEDGVQCVANSRGVAFKWQFRPVLGEHAVRAGKRWLYVQLAIPYARRPYPKYGGVVEIRTRWLPFDSSRGLIKRGPAVEEEKSVRAVFGHPFMSPVISTVDVKDLGGGSVLVIVSGSYLIGATVRVGATVFNASSPGFLTSYNSLQFTTTAQALAQSGAVITSSSGVDTPITANSLCKAADPFGECYRKPVDSRSARFKISRITIDPVSDSTSQVRVVLSGELKLSDYRYYRYFRQQGDVVGTSDDRKPAMAVRALEAEAVDRINSAPIVAYAGGKAYGFSDLPLQYLDPEKDSVDESSRVIAFIAANDSLNTSPQLKVQRLFGDPQSDSAVVSFVPPNALSLSPIPPPDKVASGAATDKKTGGSSGPPANTKGCDQNANTCEYTLSGALVDQACLYQAGVAAPRTAGDDSCSLKSNLITLSAPNSFGHSVRKLTAAKGTRQVALQFALRNGGDSGSEDLDDITQIVALPLAGLPNNSTGDAVAALTNLTPAIPNFTLVRSVQVERELDGIAYITVGIQKLKDQTATLTVGKANIVSVLDGNNNALSILPGGQVTVSQDTAVTFKLRDPDPGKVNVTAEGKNGTVSTGKVQFKNPFSFISPPSGTHPELKH